MRAAAPKLVLLGAALFCCACIGPQRTLLVDPSARTSAGDPSIATQTRDGIRVTARVDAWSGDTVLRDQLTPVLITIFNERNSPVSLELGNLSLVGDSGRVYAAEKPSAISGTARKFEKDVYPPSVGDLGTYSFEVPYTYPSIYPRAPMSYAELPPPASYYGLYGGTWGSVALPTEEMLHAAIREGRIGPHEQESGFVYFQRVAHDETKVSLRMDVAGPAGSPKMTRLDFPFVVVD